MPSAFSWLMLVPSSLRLPAPVNLGVRLQMAVEGIISILEVAVNAVAAVFQLALHTLAAGLGPWRYLLSTSYRTSVNSRYQGSSRFKKLIVFTLLQGKPPFLADLPHMMPVSVIISRPARLLRYALIARAKNKSERTAIVTNNTVITGCDPNITEAMKGRGKKTISPAVAVTAMILQ